MPHAPWLNPWSRGQNFEGRIDRLRRSALSLTPCRDPQLSSKDLPTDLSTTLRGAGIVEKRSEPVLAVPWEQLSRLPRLLVAEDLLGPVLRAVLDECAPKPTALVPRLLRAAEDPH